MSEFELDGMLMIGKSGGWKAKSGIIGIGLFDWLGGNLSDGGLQFVGS